MSTEMQTKVQASPAQNFTPVQTGLLQRKSALCNTSGLVEDSERDKEKLTLQRSSVYQAGTTTVPPIMHEVLRSPGKPQDVTTHAYIEPRFGHDFNRVSVHSTRPGMIQTKLEINKPGDPYEQEADRVADAVMRMPPKPGVQREVEPEEEERLQAKPLASQITPLVQRKPDPVEEEDEEKQIQPKNNIGMAPQVTPRVAHDIHSFKGTGQPLPASERTFFEPRFGRDFSNVRVHTNERAARTAQTINARAFTLGHDVVFGVGQYTPGSRSGRSLLAHELTHVVQQNDGTIVRQKRGRIPLPASTGRAPLINYHDSTTQQVIRMKPSNRSLSVPQWNQLPELARRELELKKYNESNFNQKNDIYRLSVLNLYVKLRGLNLWQYVSEESHRGIGSLNFIAKKSNELQKTLQKRDDFTDPESGSTSKLRWSSREKRSTGSLHFKQYSDWDKEKVEGHIDKAGLHGWIIPIIGPIIQLIKHWVDWARDGYQDVYGIRNILLGQGWWRQPLIVERQTAAPTPAAATGGLTEEMLKQIARTLREAMKGLGTDEEAIYSAFSGRTQEQVDAIARVYQKIYGANLLADLRDELTDSEMEHLAIFSPTTAPGKVGSAQQATAFADQIAHQLNKAMDRLGTDEHSIYSALTGRTQAELQAIKVAYKRLTDRELEADIRDEMSGSELTRALALLNQGVGGSKAGSVESDAARIESLLSYGIFDWAITDEDAIEALETFSNLPTSMQEAVLRRINIGRLRENLPQTHQHILKKILAQVGGEPAVNVCTTVEHIQDLLSYIPCSPVSPPNSLFSSINNFP